MSNVLFSRGLSNQLQISDLAFYYLLIDWRMSKKEKVYFVFLSQFWENNCTKLWQILANFKSFKPAHQLSSENKTLQELPILPLKKILGQPNVNNHVFLLVVLFTSLVSLVSADLVFFLHLSCIVYCVCIIWISCISYNPWIFCNIIAYFSHISFTQKGHLLTTHSPIGPPLISPTDHTN